MENTTKPLEAKSAIGPKTPQVVDDMCRDNSNTEIGNHVRKLLSEVVKKTARHGVARDGSQIHVWLRKTLSWSLTQDDVRAPFSSETQTLRSAGIGGWCSLHAAEALNIDPEAMETQVEEIASEFPDISIGVELEIGEEDARNVDVVDLSGERQKLIPRGQPVALMFWAAWNYCSQQLIVEQFYETFRGLPMVLRMVATDDSLETVKDIIANISLSSKTAGAWQSNLHVWAGPHFGLGADHAVRSLRVTGLSPCVVFVNSNGEAVLTFPLSVTDSEDSNEFEALQLQVQNLFFSQSKPDSRASGVTGAPSLQFHSLVEFHAWLKNQWAAHSSFPEGKFSVDVEEVWIQDNLQSISLIY
mmetsp:Transcript_8398/g.16713  ORF Transcript_8398/g.16713 Transcript_8398/m.16713 type:complete len:358 (-) Transcript_8398:1360-2433(-)